MLKEYERKIKELEEESIRKIKVVYDDFAKESKKLVMKAIENPEVAENLDWLMQHNDRDDYGFIDELAEGIESVEVREKASKVIEDKINTMKEVVTEKYSEEVITEILKAWGIDE